MTFGYRVRKKRQKINLTQKELAAAVYVGQSTISAWESRRFPITNQAMIETLAKELDTTTEYLVNGRKADEITVGLHGECDYCGDPMRTLEGVWCGFDFICHSCSDSKKVRVKK